DILEIFKNTAHRLDIQTAVEIGELVPVRCIRIHTNIDLTKVRFNSVRYNIRDLESKIYVPERNTLIVDTFMDYVVTKRTVIFCASVKHAEQIAAMIRERGVSAEAVSGGMRSSERKEYLAKFAKGKIKALCACDLLNEGWDCPETEVLFMARPTMSKVLYTQQLGRGMRLAEGKECLLVFDFVDNASQYNMPYSMHRLFKLNDYRAGKLVLGKQSDRAADDALYARGEKPEVIVDFPVSATDYEAVDIFNWQEEAAGMLSQLELVRRVNVQEGAVQSKIDSGELIPDLIVPISEHRVFKYFKEETLAAAAEKFGWEIITDDNRKRFFIDMVRRMDMSYSYKPVLMKAILQYADAKGRIKLDDIVAYFRSFYERRREQGLVVEKPNSIYARGGCTDKEIQRNILANPFKRFEDMQMLRHTKTLGIVEVEPTVWKALTEEEKSEIAEICDRKLGEYYARFI
ncbi:MAG: DEAD/DEAH box helicase, partial [Oscillospiraceae bacterium]